MGRHNALVNLLLRKFQQHPEGGGTKAAKSRLFLSNTGTQNDAKSIVYQ